jgi:hypothetical protein
MQNRYAAELLDFLRLDKPYHLRPAFQFSQQAALHVTVSQAGTFMLQ